MGELHVQLMAMPARRVAADSRRRFWWAISSVFTAVVSPLLLLSLMPAGTWAAAGATSTALLLGLISGFIGVLRGVVIPPSLDDDAIEQETRGRAREKLQVRVVALTP